MSKGPEVERIADLSYISFENSYWKATSFFCVYCEGFPEFLMKFPVSRSSSREIFLSITMQGHRQ